MQAGEKAYDIAADLVLSAGSPLRNQLGLKGNPVLHTRTLEELFLLASAGVGIGLLPSSVPGYLRPDLCSVPIDGPQWNFSFLLISRRERSRASVRAMFELAEHL